MKTLIKLLAFATIGIGLYLIVFGLHPIIILFLIVIGLITFGFYRSAQKQVENEDKDFDSDDED